MKQQRVRKAHSVIIHTHTNSPSCLSAKMSAVQTPPPPRHQGAGFRASEGEDAGWLRKTQANYGTLVAIGV